MKQLILTGFMACVFTALAPFALAEAKSENDYQRKAFTFCNPGDSCVAVKSSCNSWAAVRDVYAENAVTYFKKNAEEGDCAPAKKHVSTPVAVCSFAAGRCILTVEHSMVIDPRMRAY